MEEGVEGCGKFSLVGHRVAFVSPVVSSRSVRQHDLGVGDPGADPCLVRRGTSLTFIERRLALVCDAFTLVSRRVWLDPTGLVGGAGSTRERFVGVQGFLRSL